MLPITCSSLHFPAPLLIIIISCLGLIVILNHLISLFKWIFHTCFRPETDLAGTYGSWALVTGATDGIGKAMAHELARKGLNLILVSRTAKKLEMVACEIRDKHPGTRIETIQVDFSGEFSAGLRRITEVAMELDLGVLINNVGVTYPGAMFFHEVEEEVWRNLVRVNIESTTRVTKAVLCGMLQRKRGAIVNIGSGAGVVAPSHPLFTIYAATKAYVHQFSRSLNMEYGQHGIHVQCQVPLYVATKMVSRVASIKQNSLFIPTPEGYARAAIRAIGYEPISTPYWAHSIQWCFARLIPDPLLDAWRLSIGMRRRNYIKGQKN
ncbi:very-long-chain 3-oxoacyl-CoA reductase-like protein At1g24470 [Lotus japonicus]|uniref:very-long-chain 3-oxoacyl-CoA reductase-like protein At1g24470 n=1 Tax=Lotus japonicus TaxID=34305 RepID=UPI0025895DA5|nr:very-long-chain 3-oxoacyl-CoA reductase-like protein At1g24470 [Lotus japonicus]